MTIVFSEVASGLRFPEGPVAFADSSVVVAEVARGTLTRCVADRAREVVAATGGGPGGCAVGPDGALYICNGGGTAWRECDGTIEPWGQGADYAGGRIERVDLATGGVRVLYTHCDGHRLSSPNDLVFDAHGGFYFSDLGKMRPRDRDRGGVYYATADGLNIRQVIFPLETPNGVGLSPEGGRLYVAETITGRLWAFDVIEPGVVRQREDRWAKGTLVLGLPGLQFFDSLAVQADGAICVATLVHGGITRVRPDGSQVEHFAFPDQYTTNICFGGADMKTAFVTLSSTGRLVACEWDAPGLTLNYA